MASMQNAILEGLFGVVLVARAEVAAAAMYIWDYVLTFGMEVDLVWSSRWNIIKVLFLVQRYLPLVDTCILTLYRDLLPGRSIHGCAVIEQATGYMYVAGYVVSEILLTLRVWAVWNRHRVLSVILPIGFLVVWAPAFVAMYFFQKGLQFAPMPSAGLSGCFIIHTNDVIKWCWVSLIIWNAVTVSLMIIPGVRDCVVMPDLPNFRSTRLWSIVYRDGTYFFIYLFVLSILNIILSVTVIPTKRFFFSSLERSLHAILASRAILHMRNHVKRQVEWELTEILTGNPIEDASPLPDGRAIAVRPVS
ncbi:hypothetical protein CPB84DRAFT_1842022 [Gymnopilus junonius]|uniref:DUF6533 domain-containing protein n=1 Tax=Gymnopilus junonius TaxID=109634 RepID=A0A9P5TTU8_GYMJU|nr:hypothetical protein CPB84DRAFT_1842022 [Gymnopilus junonius]